MEKTPRWTQTKRASKPTLGADVVKCESILRHVVIILELNFVDEIQ